MAMHSTARKGPTLSRPSPGPAQTKQREHTTHAIKMLVAAFAVAVGLEPAVFAKLDRGEAKAELLRTWEPAAFTLEALARGDAKAKLTAALGLRVNPTLYRLYSDTHLRRRQRHEPCHARRGYPCWARWVSRPL